MPRIKSPISPAEILYNKRYEREVQIQWITSLTPKKLNEWEDNFLITCINILKVLKGNLSETQADKLAEIYDKY